MAGIFCIGLQQFATMTINRQEERIGTMARRYLSPQDVRTGMTVGFKADHARRQGHVLAIRPSRHTMVAEIVEDQTRQHYIVAVDRLYAVAENSPSVPVTVFNRDQAVLTGIRQLIAQRDVVIYVDPDGTDWSAGYTAEAVGAWRALAARVGMALEDGITHYVRRKYGLVRTKSLPRRFFVLSHEAPEVIERLAAEAAKKCGQGSDYLETMAVAEKRLRGAGRARFPKPSLQAGRFIGRDPDYDDMDDDSTP